MRNYLICVTLSLLSATLSAKAEEPLRASVIQTWTVDTARQEAFRDLAPMVDVSQVSVIDPNLIENLQIRAKGGGQIGSRFITVFSNGGYAVSELCSEISYYYLNDGKLIEVGIYSSPRFPNETCSSSLPIKGAKYCVGEFCLWSNLAQGSLSKISISTTPLDNYIFNPDGSLSNHWVNNNCFKADGSSCGVRKILVVS